MAGWTVADMPDLAGRRAIVTGANSGLGLQTALGLARAGAQVTLACRSMERGARAEERIRESVPDATTHLAPLDLADLDSIRAFAGAYEHDGLDLLINNAGVMALPRRVTKDGFEMQFGTNHLGHFVLTGLLLPLLRQGDQPRVVTVTSFVHWAGRLRFDDLHGERGYGRWPAYFQSKLANLVFAKELARRVEWLTSVAAHPGYAATNLQTAGPKMSGNRLRIRMYRLANMVAAQSDAAGALPVLYAATAPGVEGGQCYGPRRWMQQRGRPGQVRTSARAADRDLGRQLWEISEDLTGVSFP